MSDDDVPPVLHEIEKCRFVIYPKDWQASAPENKRGEDAVDENNNDEGQLSVLKYSLTVLPSRPAAGERTAEEEEIADDSATNATTTSNDTVIDFYSTFVPVPFRGKGYSEKLVTEGVAWAKQQGFTLKASCWYVEKFL